MLKTKEQLLYFFNGQNIKLSPYDDRFCQNLQQLITKNNRVTTNQKDLFEKLISKYKKQITQSGLDAEACKQLSWTTNIVPSEEKYTGAQVSLDHTGQHIVVRVPFNKKFLNSLREGYRPHGLEWVRDKKHYIAPLTTTTIKFLVVELPRHFNSVNFDNSLRSVIDTANLYNDRIFNPTLVRVNNNYLIAAINSDLHEHIKHIELNDDPKTLFLLSQYGISVDDDLINDDKKKLFAATVVVSVDVEHLSDAITWLHEFGVDVVYFGGRFSSSSTIMYNFTRAIKGNSYTKKINKVVKGMQKHLDILNIRYTDHSSFFSKEDIAFQPAVIQFMQGVETNMHDPRKRISKYIVVVDSSPIEIINETS